MRPGASLETLPRDEIYLAQTPQAFLRGRAARRAGACPPMRPMKRCWPSRPVTRCSWSRAIRATSRSRRPTIWRWRNVCWAAVAARRPCASATATTCIGSSTGRPLILGGVTIPFDKGLLGHSDADAICHAVTDAILGAAGAGDIGRHFPDTDPAWKDADSLDLLRRAAGDRRGSRLRRRQRRRRRDRAAAEAGAARRRDPRAAWRRRSAAMPSQVSVKGKTNEGVDSMGAGESIAVHAVALLVRLPLRRSH